MDFIGNYILAKRYARTLDDTMTFLLNNYIVYGFLSFPEEMKDRFVIEVLMLIGHNLKQKPGQKLGLQACYALVLSQSLITSLHEHLTRSQVQDIVVAAMQVMQTDKKSQTVLTACFTTLDAAMVYCPMIAIQTLLQRNFFFNFVSVLNKKLVTICQTYYDRRLLLLAVVSLLRHTSDSKELEKLDAGQIFRFGVLLLDYHLLLSNLHDDTSEMRLQQVTEFGNLQKNMMTLSLVVSDDDGGILEDGFMHEEQAGDTGNRKRRHDEDDDDYSDNYSDVDSLYASHDSEDFKNHDFDVH